MLVMRFARDMLPQYGLALKDQQDRINRNASRQFEHNEKASNSLSRYESN